MCRNLNAWLLAMLILLSGGSILADVIVTNTGFEMPTYSIGALAGQDGWFDGDAVVQDSVQRTGTQAVRFSGFGQAAQSLTEKAAIYVPAAGSTEIVVVGIDFMTPGKVDGGAHDDKLAWCGIGVIGNNQFIGQISLEPSGRFSTATDDVGGFVEGPSVVTNQWHRLEITYDFANNKQTSFVDGSPFNEMSIVNAATQIDAIYLGFDFSVGGTGAGTTIAFWDNATVTAVPEANAFWLLAWTSGFAFAIRNVSAMRFNLHQRQSLRDDSAIDTP